MTATAAPPEPLLSADEFIQKYVDAKGVELVEGRLVRLPMPGAKHSEVNMEAGLILSDFTRPRGLGRILVGDTFIRTIIDPPSFRGADVCYLSYSRWPKERELPAGVLETPPELVVEVKSPSDRWGNIQIKVGEYLNAGVNVVIVLDPDTESASVHRQDELHQLVHNGDTLTISDVLPGFSVPVKRFFA